MKSFNHNADLLRFTTEGLTTLLALQLCGLDSKDQVPEDLPDSTEEREQYLLELARHIVEMVWQQVSARDLESVIDAEDDDNDDDDDDDYYEYCFCKEGKRPIKFTQNRYLMEFPNSFDSLGKHYLASNHTVL